MVSTSLYVHVFSVCASIRVSSGKYGQVRYASSSVKFVSPQVRSSSFCLKFGQVRSLSNSVKFVPSQVRSSSFRLKFGQVRMFSQVCVRATSRRFKFDSTRSMREKEECVGSSCEYEKIT